MRCVKAAVNGLSETYQAGSKLPALHLERAAASAVRFHVGIIERFHVVDFGAIQVRGGLPVGRRPARLPACPTGPRKLAEGLGGVGRAGTKQEYKIQRAGAPSEGTGPL